MYEDKANNKYRMFSSEQAYAMWSENPTDNQDLELFNFVRPSDYKLDLTATDSGGFNNRYIREGDVNNIGARISYIWNIYNDEGESSDSLSVKYTITNTTSGSSVSFNRWYNRSDADPNFGIYNYLQPGENVVTIEAKGTTTGARNTKTFTIILLTINLSSTFAFYDKFTTGVPLQIPYVFERNNTAGSAKIYFRIDEGGTGKLSSTDVVQDGPMRVTNIQQMVNNLSEGQHSLQIWAEAKYNDGQTTINSNLLYYTFTVASSQVGSVGKFINIAQSYPNVDSPLSNLVLNETQYNAAQLQWGYYTDSLQSNTSISVTWKLMDGLDDANPTVLGTITANSREKAQTLQYIPTIYTQDGHNTYLCAYFGSTRIVAIPIYIIRNTSMSLNETGFYELKMNAYGRTNESVDKDTWLDETGNISTTFTNIQWNTNSGWYNNSFRTSGSTEYATIQFQPFDNFNFSTGKTIEIEFESEKVSSNDDVLITIGNANGARIEITPDTATLYSGAGAEVVHTNYKSNERIKLAFIINSIPANVQDRTVESGLAYIVNNGILERAASASGQSFNASGAIKIGGSASGVRIYMIRVYNYSISYTDAYSNYLYDSDKKAIISEDNNILDGTGAISFDLCKNKLDTILISGDLSNILSGSTDKDDSTTDVTIERFCPSDSTKNFKISNVQIRKHGQSTLNYPITSMKFWLNKSKAGSSPTFDSTQQESLLLNKNRYVMKSATDGGKQSIPANKFVLQANYADSSGVHNGGLQRLIQTSWFNALIDGEYKLRTAPQLFTTNQLIHHNNQELGETDWVEGYGQRNTYDNQGNAVSSTDVQWSDVTSSDFPYDIEIAPDSFPCAVFYYDEDGEQKRKFLGQYVFMEDKKSDFNFGERSIYAIPADPFCLTNTHKNDDTKENRVWNNKDVLRVEVLGSNVPFTSYMTHDGFTDIVSVEDTSTGNVTQMYAWEQSFELIYPDGDDVIKDDADNGMTRLNPQSKYVRTMQPFIDFHEWVCSTRNNQQKFEQEAAQHLDLYKMAAYYVFAMRFGLVDSLERNAQIKTYDGRHFHYEPWDMDIALGNKNDGGIAYEPPIDRTTKLPGSVTTYAFSGRSANQDGTIATSNWLFDALEAWGYWANTIVPQVADALFNAGLTYDNITKMFDQNYADAWCETMYNESGYFKYIESGQGDPTWLSWLQGARMSHRHWWLSNSMDYYDAKWFCGDYKNHYIYIRANVTEGSNEGVTITPNKATYMSVTKDGIIQATQSVSKYNPLIFSMSGGSNTKNPIYFYGANFMEDIDLSEISLGLDGVSLYGVYSEVLGSPLKRLNVGTIMVPRLGGGYTTTVGVSGCDIQGNANVFQNLQYLNIQGQQNQTDMSSLMYNYNLTEVQEVYAKGSGLTNFYSSESGNKFTQLELPDSVYTLYMNNSTWDNLSFWTCTIGQNNEAVVEQIQGVPATLHNLSLLGTTGSTLKSINLVRDWLTTLVNSNADLSQYTLTMDKINWSPVTVGEENLLTYEELGYIAQLRNSDQLKGYIVLRNTGADLTAEELTEIKSWFGDTVFTKNSSGLVVDHIRTYVQINIGGQVTVDNGEIYLVEGNNASLNATRFSLAEDDNTNYAWSVGPVGSQESYSRYNGLTVIQQDSSIDGIAYIQSTQSQVGSNYDVQVTCSIYGVAHSVTIHVIAATYPTDMFIDCSRIGNIGPRTVADYIEYYTSGIRANVFVNSHQNYTGTINRITYTFKRLSDNTQVQYVDGGSTTAITNMFDDYLTLGASPSTHGMLISMDTAMPQTDQFYQYSLSATVLFASGKQIQTGATIVVCDDVTPVVLSTQTMYSAINTAWQTQYGSAIGKNSLYKVDLLAIATTLDFTPYTNTLQNLVTANGSYLLKYLLNTTGIILDGCTNITTQNQNIIGSNKTQLDFSRMYALQNLSIQNCTGMTGNIDLSNCTDIRQVDASGTTVNVIVPAFAKLTKYELGTPTSVNLTNPTVLTPAQVNVDTSTSIQSIDLINIPNCKSFSTFAKIMNIS